MREFGYKVWASDIADRGYIRAKRLTDFLKVGESDMPYLLYDCDIVTNPPYRYATEFVLKALELLAYGRKCCMFLKLTFLEGKGRYEKIFKYTPPKSVYVFSERILCAKNGDFEALKSSGGSAVAYAWFVWEKGYAGETKISWI